MMRVMIGIPRMAGDTAVLTTFTWTCQAVQSWCDLCSTSQTNKPEASPSHDLRRIGDVKSIQPQMNDERKPVRPWRWFMAIIRVIATVLIKKPNCTLQVGHYNAYQYRCLCMFNANEVKPMTNLPFGGWFP